MVAWVSNASAGASFVTFVDKSFQSIQVLKRNLNHLKITDNYTIIHSDVLSYLKNNTKPVDFILADPPFRWNKLNELLDLVFQKENLRPEGVLILESEKSHSIIWETDRFEIIQQKTFDRSIITFMGWKHES